MARVLMNGDISGVEYPCATWGDLLPVLDEQCATTGDVVVGVRVGDVEFPEFRTPSALSHVLGADAEVFIETARPTDLIHETLDEADAAVPSIVEAALELGRSYRQADASAVNRALPGFAESLSMLIVVTSTVAQGAGVDLTACGDGSRAIMEMITDLTANMDTLLAAQQTGNWIDAANVIESDIVETVRRWPLVLEALRQAAPALSDVA